MINLTKDYLHDADVSAQPVNWPRRRRLYEVRGSDSGLPVTPTRTGMDD
jgi:hypothetical protein